MTIKYRANSSSTVQMLELRNIWKLINPAKKNIPNHAAASISALPDASSRTLGTLEACISDSHQSVSSLERTTDI